MQRTYPANSYYLGLIQNLYAGSQGCLAAFLQFFYQYGQCVVFGEDLTECFRKLYETELENCTILSEVILRLGGDNKFFSNSRKFLSCSCVDYVKSSERMFLTDIELLEVNIIDVKGVIYKVEDEQIRDRLKILLANKKNELKMLKQQYFKTHMVG